MKEPIRQNRFFFLPEILLNQRNHPSPMRNHPFGVRTKKGVFCILKMQNCIFFKNRQMTRLGRWAEMGTYRVLLVEEREIYRLYLEQMICDSDQYTLIGIEADMEEAVKQCAHTPVDLILAAAADKEGNTNFAAAKRCKTEYSHIRIVLMTDVPEYTYLRRAEDCGADSFWYMEDAAQPILSVLDRTMTGESVFPEHSPSVKVGQMESCDLTEKELLILREVAKGNSNQEIAAALQMSYYTVRDYVKGMLEKTALKNRTALAAAAVGSGLIVLEKGGSKPVR